MAIATLANGVSFIEATDPTGNNNPAVEAVHLGADGQPDDRPGVFFVKHAGGFWRLFIGNSGGAHPFFETNSDGSTGWPVGNERIAEIHA